MGLRHEQPVGMQIPEGNLLPTTDYAWHQVAYFQMGDTGINEPNSRETNCKNALKHIHDKGYRGFMGLEHGTNISGKEGDRITLQAYRSVDPE